MQKDGVIRAGDGVAAGKVFGGVIAPRNDVYPVNIGLEPDESDMILEFLIDHLKKPIFQCRLHWEDDTVVVWDNRATQHQVLADFQPSYRLNQRIAIKDDIRPHH